MQEITVQNIGPVEKVSIPVPESGVVVLKGRNGSGKSHTLGAVQSILSGSGKLPVRDGEAVGVVNGLGCVITVGRQTRRAGELNVEEIESRFDISKLIDPQISDPLAADSARMKALLRLLGVEPNAKVFHELLGGKEEFENVVSSVKLDTGDVVNMASQVKRAIEAEARREETKAQEAAAQMKANQAGAFGIDVTKEHDDSILRQQYETAVKKKSEIVARKDANDKTLKNAESAKLELEKLRSEKKDLLSVAEAEHAVNVSEKKVESTRELLDAAQKNYDAAVALRDKSKSQLQYAKTLEITMKKWEEQIVAAQNIEIITQKQIDSAFEKLGEAQIELENGVLIRKAKEFLAIADKEMAKHLAHLAKAKKLRAAAGNVDNVLSSLIKTPKLKINAGRLVTKTDRGQTFFSDLSEGEKWRLAIELTAPVVGEGGLLVAEQNAWQDLDQKNKKEVAEICRKAKVVLITAEATNGELKAEIFKEDKSKKSK